MDSDVAFLEYVVKALVDNPNDVKAKRTVDEMGVLITLDVNPADMGKVIGKSGNTAKAIRTLLRVVRYVILKKGLRLGNETRREIGKLAKEIDVPKKNLENILYPMYRIALSQVFPDAEDLLGGYVVDVERGNLCIALIRHQLRV